MTLDLARVGEPLPAVVRSWDDTATMLYALGVGATELRYTTENSEGVKLVALPSLAVTLRGRLLDVLATLGDVDPATALHAEERVELHRPLPSAGTVSTTTAVRAVYDKDPHALVIIETTGCAPDDEPLFTTSSSVMLRGAGGFGGERGPSARGPASERAPDHVVEQSTRTDQALLYRLTGDRNPLHSDPARATRAGFDRPILHGLCTLGFACRALVDTVAGGDPRAVAALSARFSSPVFPGETLRTEIFVDTDGTGASFRVTAAGAADESRGVLERGALELRTT